MEEWEADVPETNIVNLYSVNLEDRIFYLLIQISTSSLTELDVTL